MPRMPHAATRVLPVVFLLASFAFLHADDALKARMSILPFYNVEKDSRYDALCRTVTRNIEFSVGLLGKYVLVPVPQADASGIGSIEDAKAFAEREKIDYFIMGTMEAVKKSGYLFRISVYERSTGGVTISHETNAAGVFDVFDAADKLSLLLLESLSGYHAGFGSLVLKNTGEKGSYEVFINGISLGSDIESVEKVLNGNYLLTIEQNRMEAHRVIREAQVRIVEDETTEVSFSLPVLFPDEAKKIADLERTVTAGWKDEEASADVEAAIAALVTLVSEADWSPKLAERAKYYRQADAEFRIRKNREEIISKLKNPSKDLIRPVLEFFRNAGKYPDPDAITSGVETNAELLMHAFALSAWKETEAGRFGRGLELFAEMNETYAYLRTGIGETLRTEAAELESRVGRYREESGKWSAALPVATIVTGAVLGIAGGAMLALDIPGGVRREGDALKARYETMTSGDFAALKKQIQQTYQTSTFLTIGTWGSIGLGVPLAGLGTWWLLSSEPTSRFVSELRVKFSDRMRRSLQYFKDGTLPKEIDDLVFRAGLSDAPSFPPL